MSRGWLCATVSFLVRSPAQRRARRSIPLTLAYQAMDEVFEDKPEFSLGLPTGQAELLRTGVQS